MNNSDKKTADGIADILRTVVGKLKNRRTAAVIVAGGSSSRMGGETPKQFMLLGGMPVVAMTVRAYEQEVIRLVNAERAKYGLSALTEDWELSRVARYKSQDMHDRGYFDHTSPTYGTPFQMMRAFGLTYRSAGENIAMGYRTPQAVVTGWMNSPGHRANILSSSYKKIGVGYVPDGNYWTQMFIG